MSSPAIQLMDLTWKSACGATAHAWERYNHALRAALHLAIGGGMEFDEGDYAHILKSYRTGHWIGDSDEWVYALAIEVGNMSAVESFEAARGRVAIIADDVDLGGNSGFAHNVGRRDRERLAVGFSFRWKGQKVVVTSWQDGYVVACSYREVGERVECGECRHQIRWPRTKVAKRFKITREDVIADRAERKERHGLEERLRAAPEAARRQALEDLGVKTQAQFDAAPLARLRAVVERLPAPQKGATDA